MIAALAVCIAVIVWFILFTQRRYKKIAQLSLYLERMVNGNWWLDIRDNAEGELSILKNELYKVTHALNERADALQKDKTELSNALSDISHQLKTPLTALGMMADLLDNDTLPPDKRREFLDNLRLGLTRMEWLVLTLLKLARLDADAAALKREPIQLSALCENALTPLLIPAEAKEVSIAIAGADATVLCNPGWTAEALGNIFKNAVESTPPGGRIVITTGANPLYAYIEVRDSGPGIDKADLPHLFQRFYRGKNAGSDSVGIGLAMSLSVMRKQNGDIEAENDNGGVFTVKFYDKTVT